MLVKFEADQTFADRIKTLTGQAVASKAFYSAASDALELVEEVRDLRRQLADAHRQIQVQKQVIERARDSAAALLDHVAQGDLLD